MPCSKFVIAFVWAALPHSGDQIHSVVRKVELPAKLFKWVGLFRVVPRLQMLLK